ncbi:hypothetical protein BD324DRAFT_649199 [Kockovaella imperatae]|uniref:Uncharacterized protein n=1 Tax=Kockovaella imperatae TaxID=4999 RepID=A0A1Y1UM20_9TREE|nr:hypothetical protein BD324DRAFT_649199 [Kockovaella imperatae]ORX39108.1 hypothetical protein BD324DRAFT_649199 [Kockovaella imperatae]
MSGPKRRYLPGSSRDRPIVIHSSSDTEDDGPISVTANRLVGPTTSTEPVFSNLDTLEEEDSDEESDDWASAVSSIRSRSATPTPRSVPLRLRGRSVDEGVVPTSSAHLSSSNDTPSMTTASSEAQNLGDWMIESSIWGGIIVGSELPNIFGFSSVPVPSLRWSEDPAEGSMQEDLPLEDELTEIGSLVGLTPSKNLREGSAETSRPPTPPLDIDRMDLDADDQDGEAEMEILPISSQPSPRIHVQHIAAGASIDAAGQTPKSSRPPTPDLKMNETDDTEMESRPPTPPLSDEFTQVFEPIDTGSMVRSSSVSTPESSATLKRASPISTEEEIARPSKRSLMSPTPAIITVQSKLCRSADSSSQNPPIRSLLTEPSRALEELNVNADNISPSGLPLSTKFPKIPSSPAESTIDLGFVPDLHSSPQSLDIIQVLSSDRVIAWQSPLLALGSPRVPDTEKTLAEPSTRDRPSSPAKSHNEHGHNSRMEQSMAQWLIHELCDATSKCLAHWQIVFVSRNTPSAGNLSRTAEAMGASILDLDSPILRRPFHHRPSDSPLTKLDFGRERLIVFPPGPRDTDYDVFAKHVDAQHVDEVEVLEMISGARRRERAETARKAAVVATARLKAQMRLQQMGVTSKSLPSPSASADQSGLAPLVPSTADLPAKTVLGQGVSRTRGSPTLLDRMNSSPPSPLIPVPIESATPSNPKSRPGVTLPQTSGLPFARSLVERIVKE